MYQRTVLIDLPKVEAIDIEFKNVTFNVSSGFYSEKKPILKGVSGCFKSGELTAIMGPSGAGKSSLLNLLTGFHDVNAGNNINYINRDTAQSLNVYRKAACYIQQDDQLHLLFTTIESMRIAANLKIGNSLSNEAKELLIDDILETLDLIKAKETRCNHLSGGQKKRLSIALELIDNPPVMFLDEPTTGLDSSSTLQCISMLQNLTRNGRTIICTIHQPSATIYEMFDHIYLLADGHCMYQGAPKNTVAFFSRVGLQCPKYHNPADYIIEVVSKEYGNFNEQLKIFASRNTNDYWRVTLLDDKSSSIYLTDDKQNETTTTIATTTTTTAAIKISKRRIINNENKAVIFINPPSELIRFGVLFNRCMIQLYRDWTVTHLKMILHFLVGVLLGLFYVNAGSDGSKSFHNIGFLIITLVYLCYTSMMPAVLRFPSELPVLKKEKFNNWYKLHTYYAATLTAQLPIQALFTVIYCSVSYLMSSQPLDWNRFIMFLVTSILITFIAESMGLILGIVVNPVNGTFFGAIATCVMLIFAGFLALFRHMPVFMYYISYLSYLRYGLDAMIEAIYGNNREKLPCPIDYCHYRIPASIIEELSMGNGRFWLDIGVLFLNFILLRLVAYCALKRNLSKS
ncbi:hypothetical protein PV325_007354 [Microctonus aethiopoides]|uniref:ABC transporter domain-containing protein n=1 Tax=Microctonus aethiopoides TaxID=144406 RepID=A0AA39FA99_9HYME|nr:hypothetical protein PV325_007354 [Microctonus aethiopoides]KAK0165847.1 hypothetical protein PV328_004331 [Microctonus aethiopoides]